MSGIHRLANQTPPPSLPAGPPPAAVPGSGPQATGEAERPSSPPPPPPPGERPVPQTPAEIIGRIQEYAGNSSEDLACALDVHDAKLGSGTRNVADIEFLEDILGFEKTEIPELLGGRPWAVIVPKSPSPTAPLKLLHNKSQGTALPQAKDLEWVMPGGKRLPFSPADLEPLGREDRIIMANTTYVDDRVETFHDRDTTDPSGPSGSQFYHEKQSGGQCGIHAMNAFVGKRTVLPSALTEFNKKTFGGAETTHVTRFPSEYTDNAPERIFLADEGNNPVTLVDYVKELTREGRLEPRYQSLEVLRFHHKEDAPSSPLFGHLKDVQNTSDRLVLGRNKPTPHYIAFRKDKTGQWFKVDSLTDKQEAISPQDYIAKLAEQDLFIIQEGNTDPAKRRQV